MEPEICPTMRKKLSEKLRAKFPVATCSYPMVKTRQVQKSDRINSDPQSMSDQLGLSRIIKKKIQLKVNENFTHLKVKIPGKNGPK